MKKLITGLLVLGVMLMASSTLRANGTAPAPEPVAEGVEISGAVDVVAGWQNDNSDVAANAVGIGGMADYDAGDIGTAGDSNHFRFVVNQVEIDLAKSFGENIRLRADIDVYDLTNSGQQAGDAVDLEQGYVTANLAAGNGIEFLIGKFAAPVGVEGVDTRDNWLISYGVPYRYMTPALVTGAKIYYAFTDHFDLHFGVVNSLNSAGFANTPWPSALFRFGWNWGEEGNESTIGLSGGIGPEQPTGAGEDNLSNLDYFGDLDLLVALSDSVNLAFEGVYRVSANDTATDTTGMGALVAANFEASDVWDITIRGGWLLDSDTGPGNSITGTNFNSFGSDGSIYSGTLGAGYMIADGAKLKLEGRYDLTAMDATTDGSAISVIGQFAYTF